MLSGDAFFPAHFESCSDSCGYGQDLFSEGSREHFRRRWRTSSHWPFLRIKPHPSWVSVFTVESSVVGLYEGTSLACLLGSSLVLACGSVTLLLTPQPALVLTTSQEVCTGSCTGQGAESFLKTGNSNSVRQSVVGFFVHLQCRTWWALKKTASPASSVSVGIDGKGAWRLKLLDSTPTGPFGVSLIPAFFFQLSLIFLVWLSAASVLTRMVWKFSKGKTEEGVIQRTRVTGRLMFGNCKKKESHCDTHFGVEEDKYHASVWLHLTSKQDGWVIQKDFIVKIWVSRTFILWVQNVSRSHMCLFCLKFKGVWGFVVCLLSHGN